MARYYRVIEACVYRKKILATYVYAEPTGEDVLKSLRKLTTEGTEDAED